MSRVPRWKRRWFPLWKRGPLPSPSSGQQMWGKATAQPQESSFNSQKLARGCGKRGVSTALLKARFLPPARAHHLARRAAGTVASRPPRDPLPEQCRTHGLTSTSEAGVWNQGRAQLRLGREPPSTGGPGNRVASCFGQKVPSSATLTTSVPVIPASSSVSSSPEVEQAPRPCTAAPMLPVAIMEGGYMAKV